MRRTEMELPLVEEPLADTLGGAGVLRTLRAIVTIVAIALVSAVLIPAQYVAMALKRERTIRVLPWWFHLATTRLIGLKVIQHGAPSSDRPLLVLSNHVSWLDITVIGSLTPLSFIAKAEVADWPIFGLFAKLQRSVFVDRTRQSRTRDIADEIAGRLRAGDVMVLFPEGTSGNGTDILPFRTALIGAARQAIVAGDEAVTVQTLTLTYTRLDGIPLGRFKRPHAAWYGDMVMAPHLWSVLTRGDIDVEVSWGVPRRFDSKTDRKRLAREAEAEVRQAMSTALGGRRGEPETLVDRTGGTAVEAPVE